MLAQQGSPAAQPRPGPGDTQDAVPRRGVSSAECSFDRAGLRATQLLERLKHGRLEPRCKIDTKVIVAIKCYLRPPMDVQRESSGSERVHEFGEGGELVSETDPVSTAHPFKPFLPKRHPAAA